MASSWTESRSSSPASRPATWFSSAVKSDWARAARCCASSSAGVSRPTSAVPDSTRLRAAATWPASRARPSRRSAAARAAAAIRRCSSTSASSASWRAVTAIGQGLAVAGDGGLDLGLLGADLLGLRLERLRVTPGARVVGLGGEVAHPLGGQAAGAAEPLAQRREPVPGLLGAGQRRRLRRGDPLEVALAGGRLGEGGLHLGAAGAQGGLVGDLCLQGRGQADQVVGEQAQAGVAQVGLDDRGPAGDLGLPAQGLELAAQLDGEVLDRG